MCYSTEANPRFVTQCTISRISANHNSLTNDNVWCNCSQGHIPTDHVLCMLKTEHCRKQARDIANIHELTMQQPKIRNKQQSRWGDWKKCIIYAHICARIGIEQTYKYCITPHFKSMHHSRVAKWSPFLTIEEALQGTKHLKEQVSGSLSSLWQLH